MNCGMKLIKYLLFFFNFIFIIFAFVLIGVGAAVELKYRPVVQITEGGISSAPVLLLCIGLFILFISVFGFVGAYRESYCMIATFAGMMVFMFILEIAAAATAYSLRAKIEDYLSSSLASSIEMYSTQNTNPMDFIQEQFKCCGALNISDWQQNITFYREATAQAVILNISDSDEHFVPDSCCVVKSQNCGIFNNRSIHTQVCVTAIEKAFKDNISSVGGVALAIIFIEIFGVIFAYVLMKTIKAQYETVE